MANLIEKEALNMTVISVVKDTFKQMCHVDFSADPVAAERDIIEYDGKMRIFPMEKFNGPACIAIVNYYNSQKDLDDKFPVGTFILFVKDEYVEKIFKAFGRPSAEAEDENAVLEIVGELCNVLAANVKNELRAMGYADLVTSAPLKYKNVVPGGAQFDYGLFKKQEITFSFWKDKTVVVEVCFGRIPKKGS